MENIYRSINRIAKTDAHTKAYHEPKYDSISEVPTEGINKVSYNKGKRQYLYDKLHPIVLILGNNITAAHTIGNRTIHMPIVLPPK